MHRIICQYLDLRFFRMLWSHKKTSHPDLMALDSGTKWAAFIVRQHWPNGLLCGDFLLFCCSNENKFQYSACLKKKSGISFQTVLRSFSTYKLLGYHFTESGELWLFLAFCTSSQTSFGGIAVTDTLEGKEPLSLHYVSDGY